MNTKLKWNETMKCTYPKHMKGNKGQPVPITKLKFNRKCRDRKCRYFQYEIVPEQKIVDEINKRFG